MRGLQEAIQEYPAESSERRVSCEVLVEPLAAIVYAHELISNVVPNLRTAAVFGAGPVGLLAAIYLSGLGVKVLLVHRTRERLDTVARLNILSPAAMLLACDDVVEQMVARNDGRAIDAALICTTREGAPSALRQAVESVKDGGCIDLVTRYPDNASAPYDIHAGTVRAVWSANTCGCPKDGKYVSCNVLGRHIALSGHRGTRHAHLQKALHELSRDVGSYMRVITECPIPTMA